MRRRGAPAAGPDYGFTPDVLQAPYWFTNFEPSSTPSGEVCWASPLPMFPYRTGVSQLLTLPFEALVKRLIGLPSTSVVVTGKVVYPALALVAKRLAGARSPPLPQGLFW